MLARLNRVWAGQSFRWNVLSQRNSKTSQMEYARHLSPFPIGPRRQPGAFTLVELLVVIGIIAVLIAVLLPALSKANQQSMRVQCSANLRSLGQALQMYAVGFKGTIPIGATGWDMRINYLVWGATTSTTSEWTMAGLLMPTKCATSPLVYYCPANSDAGTTFNETGSIPNRWAVPGTFSRSSYGFRPGYIFGNSYGDIMPPQTYGRFVWQSDQSGKVTQAPTIEDWRPNNINKRWPKINEYKNRAICGDVTYRITNIRQRHVHGVNVLYGNWAVKWVPLDPAWSLGLWDDIKNVGPTQQPGFDIGQAQAWNFFDRF